MKEIVHTYEEFVQKVDKEKPIHHCGEGKFIDKLGAIYRMWFRIYGVEKTHKHIIVFEIENDINIMSKEFFDKWHSNPHEGFMAIYNEMVEKYAKPLGSTEGRLTES